MMTLEPCASYLAGFSLSGEHSEAKIDGAINDYLAGLVGTGEMATRRWELGVAFGDQAPDSELTERIRKRIHGEDT
jgi:hypothetical protein